MCLTAPKYWILKNVVRRRLRCLTAMAAVINSY